MPASQRADLFCDLALTVQGKSINIAGMSGAVIDTGTTNIAGPAAAVQSIYAQIPGSQPGTGAWQGYYTYRKHQSGCTGIR
jgi:cathepsin D